MKFKIIKQILEDLSTSYSASIDLSIGDLVYHPYKLLYGDLKKYYRADSVSHAVSKAEKKGLIKKVINNDEVYIALTQLGKEKLVKIQENTSLDWKSSGDRWDQRYRIVFFDIPENSRVVRDALRSKLKEFGFIGWQKSVWISKENITKRLRKFLEENSLEDFVLVVETRDLGNKKLEDILKNRT